MALADAVAPGRPSAAQQQQTLAVPDGSRLQTRVTAAGTQNYVCSDVGGRRNWTFEAPEAELRDEANRLVGKHGAGPSWQWNDGSQVTGRLKVAIDAPMPNAIPWLLIESTSHRGSGVLAQVSFIQRLDTEGGTAPTEGCDAAHLGARRRVPYRAVYAFWRQR